MRLQFFFFRFSKRLLKVPLWFPQERRGPGWQRGVAVQRNVLAAPQRPRIPQHRQPASVVASAESAPLTSSGFRRRANATVNRDHLVNDPVIISRLMAKSCFQLLVVASTMARRSFESINEPLEEVRCQRNKWRLIFKMRPDVFSSLSPTSHCIRDLFNVHFFTFQNKILI